MSVKVCAGFDCQCLFLLLKCWVFVSGGIALGARLVRKSVDMAGDRTKDQVLSSAMALVFLQNFLVYAKILGK